VICIELHASDITADKLKQKKEHYDGRNAHIRKTTKNTPENNAKHFVEHSLFKNHQRKAMIKGQALWSHSVQINQSSWSLRLRRGCIAKMKR